MKVELISIISTLALCNWVPQEHRDDFISQSKYWMNFKNKFNKEQHHDVEFISASKFIANHKRAAEFNQKQLLNGETARMEINEYADMKYDEFMKLRGGLKGIKKNKGTMAVHYYSGEPLAATVDWRTSSGVLAPVQDQGQCGSCWAFSATAAIESGYAVAKKTKVLKLSEQELVNCENEDDGCNGGLMDHAFAWVEENGMTTEEEIPYTAQDGTCKYKKKDAKVFISGYKDVEATDEALKEAVSKAPVSIGVAANDAWQLYGGGTVSYNECPDDQLDHGVVLVGYTDKQWIVRNSWSESWGENGYIYLEMGKNTCGIRSNASYPVFA